MLQKTLHLLTPLLPRPLPFFPRFLPSHVSYSSAKHPHKKHRDRFKLDYDYFSSIPISDRDN